MFTIQLPMPNFDDGTVAKLKKLLTGYEQASAEGPVRGGVIVEGDAAAYALVWEWGNARQTKKGPKTTLGINPDGEQVWLSIQAPYGYIRIHEAEYEKILLQNLGVIDLSEAETAQQVLREIRKASARAGNQIAEMIRQSAPYDSGQLRNDISAASPDDADLASDDDDIELGSKSFRHRKTSSRKKYRG